MEQTLLSDNDWSIVEGGLCRVKGFSPMATIQHGKVLTLGKSVPYASVTLECKKVPQPVEGFIGHKLDFLHLWTAFKERPLGGDEEVLIIWTKKHYKGYAKIFSAFMPRLWVMVCPKEAYELETDPNFRPELKGEARWKATRPIVDWKPEVMR
jgi:hypothetical protein